MAGLQRIGAIAGVFTDPGGGGAPYLDFADDDVLELVEPGDVLVLAVFGSSIGAPSGTGWTQRATPPGWEVYTKHAVAREAAPTIEAADAGNDPAGVLLVVRGATESYVVGAADSLATDAVNDNDTPTLTVVDSNGLLVAAWLGTAGGPEPDALAAPVSAVLAVETSGASGSPTRWFVVGEAPINGVPDTEALTLHTPDPDDVHVLVVALRHRPPPVPKALAGAAVVNIGLVP